MSDRQTDLFAATPAERPPLDEAIVAMTRARLQATLDLVTRSAAMPWTDMLVIIGEDNGFRSGKDHLPAEEGARMWAAFDREMDRLYAVMNDGKEMPDD